MTRDSLVQFLEAGLKTQGRDLMDTTPLFTSGLLDSMALVDLINFLESSTDRSFNALEMGLENLDTVDKIMKFMNAL